MSLSIQPAEPVLTRFPTPQVRYNDGFQVQLRSDAILIPTSLFSYPESSYSPADSTTISQSSQRNLQSIRVIHNPCAVIMETRLQKRKRRSPPPQPPSQSVETAPTVAQFDVAVQVDSLPDASMLEVFNLKWQEYTQDMAYIKEAMLENQAKLEAQREDVKKWQQLLLESQSDNILLKERLSRMESVLREFNIPEENWS